MDSSVQKLTFTGSFGGLTSGTVYYVDVFPRWPGVFVYEWVNHWVKGSRGGGLYLYRDLQEGTGGVDDPLYWIRRLVPREYLDHVMPDEHYALWQDLNVARKAEEKASEAMRALRIQISQVRDRELRRLEERAPNVSLPFDFSHARKVAEVVALLVVQPPEEWLSTYELALEDILQIQYKVNEIVYQKAREWADTLPHMEAAKAVAERILELLSDPRIDWEQVTLALRAAQTHQGSLSPQYVIEDVREIFELYVSRPEQMTNWLAQRDATQVRLEELSAQMPALEEAHRETVAIAEKAFEAFNTVYAGIYSSAIV